MLVYLRIAEEHVVEIRGNIKHNLTGIVDERKGGELKLSFEPNS